MICRLKIRIRSKDLFKKRNAANIIENYLRALLKSNGKHISCSISKATKKYRLQLCYISTKKPFACV